MIAFWRTYIKSPHYQAWFPMLRARLGRRYGVHLFEWCGDANPWLLVIAYHPRSSITWIWKLSWWPSWRAWRGWHWSTQRRMPWRRGAFARMDESALH